MTSFIKTKFNKSDDQTNIDNIDSCKITEYQNKSSKIHGEKAIISCKKCMSNCQKSTSLNGRMDFLIIIIEFIKVELLPLLRFVTTPRNKIKTLASLVLELLQFVYS